MGDHHRLRGQHLRHFAALGGILPVVQRVWLCAAVQFYESLVFFGWTIGAIYLWVEYRYRNKTIGAFAVPLAFLAMAYASLSPDKSIQPLIPALQSNWLIAHVITCFLGYAAFAVAFAVSIMYLIKSGDEKRTGNHAGLHLPPAAVLDDITHKMVMFGFLFLTVGIITGAVWAKQAWTRTGAGTPRRPGR
jgi:ABC-type transport system involved in cytochrome c biogenesis permease subunit